MATKTSDWRPGTAVCRCCFAEGCYKDISTEYFWMGKREVYSEMLTETFDIHIGYSQTGGPNSNSRLICEPCISRLRDASDFKRQVQECEKVFLQHLAQPASSADFEIEVEVAKEEVKLERVKLENKMEDDDDFDDHVGFPDDDDDDDLDDEPLMKLASKVPKKESVELLNLLTDDKPQTTLKRKSTLKLKPSPSKKPKKKETPQPSVSKPLKPAVEKKKKEFIEDVKPDVARINAQIILKYSTLYPFRQIGRGIGCALCKNVYKDPDEFRMHVDSTHQHLNKSKAVKTVSNFSLTRVDITNLRCKECSTKFTMLCTLAEHLKDEHNFSIDLDKSLGLVPMKLEKDKYECTECARTFNGYYALSRHSGEHFALNVCHICGKKLESIAGLQSHLQSHDDNKKYYCKSCKNTFASADAKKKHSLKSNRCWPISCRECGERFKNVERRDKHLFEVHGKPKQRWACSHCDKTFPYRALRHMHFKTVHTDDFKCQLCDLKFATPTTLKIHIARYHTQEKPYKCQLCDSAYFEKGCLNRHMRIHDDSMKFPCHICGRMFVRRHRMKEHMLKEHPGVDVDDL